jgi:hypothetical protein
MLCDHIYFQFVIAVCMKGIQRLKCGIAAVDGRRTVSAQNILQFEATYLSTGTY